MCALSFLLSLSARARTHARTHSGTQRNVRLLSRVQGFVEAFSRQAMDKVKSSDAAGARQALNSMAQVLVRLKGPPSGQGEDQEKIAEVVVQKAERAVAADPYGGVPHFARSRGVGVGGGGLGEGAEAAAGGAAAAARDVVSKVREQVAQELQMQVMSEWTGADSGLVSKPPWAVAGDEDQGLCKDAKGWIAEACRRVFPCSPSAGGGEQHRNPSFSANTQQGLSASLELLCLTRVRPHACASGVCARACVRAWPCGELIVLSVCCHALTDCLSASADRRGVPARQQALHSQASARRSRCRPPRKLFPAPPGC